MNFYTLIGRLVNDVNITTNENGKKEATVTLAVTRSYKDENGVYDTDFIPVILWGGIATNTADYCRKGDLIAVKGRIEQRGEYNEDNGYDQRKLTLIADKVSFLASHRTNND